MGVQQPNSTNYIHPDEPNLLNLHKVMQYNTSGEPVLRAHVDGITLDGDVIVDKVRLWDGTHTLDFDQPSNDGELGQYSLPAEAYNMVFNGSTWDRMRGNVNDGVLVNISNDSLTVDIGTNGEVKLVAGSAVIGKVSLVDSLGNNNDTNHPVYVSGNVTVTQNAGDFTYVKYVDSTNTQLDSVGRLRVSPPTQSYWYTPSIDKDGDLRYIESFVGTGAATAFVQNIASMLLTSGTDSNGHTIRISRRRHKMRPGVSVQWQSTGAFNGVSTNCTKRRGMYTNYNGFFFQVDTDLKFVVRRRLIDGTLVEDTYNRSTWNYDTLDGSGPTGINLDPITSAVDFVLGSYVSKTAAVISATETHYNVVFNTATECPFRVGTKATITGFNATGYNSLGMIVAKTSNTVTFCYPLDPGTFTNGVGTMRQTGLHHEYTWWVDFAGDRSTRIRFGINTSDGPHVCHLLDYTGELGTHWSNAPALSDRYEIQNTGAVTIRPTMTWSSTTVNVEAESELNPGFGVAQRTTTLGISKGTRTEYALLGVGLRAGEPYQRGDLQVQGIEIIDAGNVNQQNAGVFQWRLVLNPSFAGTAVPAATDLGKASRMWNYDNGTTISGGITLTGGYVTSTQNIDVKNALNFLNLGSDIEYTDADKIVLAIKMVTDGTSDASLLATMNFIEAL